MSTHTQPITGHTNADPVTGAPGSHPGATAIGTTSGALTGAALGFIGGPIGAAIGAIVGGAVGGWTGHAAGEWNDPSDMTFWRNEYKNRSYYDKSANFDSDVAPAYQYGNALAHHVGQDQVATGTVDQARPFTEIDDKARQGWDQVRGDSKLSYDQASVAVADAYDRKLEKFRQTRLNGGPDGSVVENPSTGSNPKNV
jgi:phage tail tape-measure protein